MRRHSHLRLVILCILTTGLGATESAPPATTWDGFRPGSWIVADRGGWAAGDEGRRLKYVLTSIRPGGWASLQGFIDPAGVGGPLRDVWQRQDHGAGNSPAVTVVGRERWFDPQEGPRHVVDGQGPMTVAEQPDWRREAQPAATLNIDGDELRCAVRRWTREGSERAMVLTLYHADGIAQPSFLRRFGRQDLTFLMPADVLRYEMRIGSGDDQVLEVGQVAEREVDYQLAPGKTLTGLRWRIEDGPGRDSLALLAELVLSEQVPGHELASRHRRQDGEWRKNRLLAYHVQGPYQKVASVASGSWAGTGSGAWAEVQHAEFRMPADQATSEALSTDESLQPQKRVRREVLGLCDEGYPVIEVTELPADDGGQVESGATIKVLIPPRPLLAQGGEKVAERNITEGENAGKTIEHYQMTDPWGRKWKVMLLLQPGLELLPRSHDESLLPTNAEVIQIDKQGGKTVVALTDAEAEAEVGSQVVRGAQTVIQITTPFSTKIVRELRSREVPGHLVWRETLRTEGDEVVRLRRELVGFGSTAAGAE